jgi:hypothetical protein
MRRPKPMKGDNTIVPKPVIKIPTAAMDRLMQPKTSMMNPCLAG